MEKTIIATPSSKAAELEVFYKFPDAKTEEEAGRWTGAALHSRKHTYWTEYVINHKSVYLV